MDELILTVRVLMGLQECNHVLSTHFSFSLSLFLTLFLHGFKLGGAINSGECDILCWTVSGKDE
jgi:hypothetical protein